MRFQLATLTFASVIHGIALTNATHDLAPIVAVGTLNAALLRTFPLAITFAHRLNVNLSSLANTLCANVKNNRFERAVGQSLWTLGELDFDSEIDLLFDFQSVT